MTTQSAGNMPAWAGLFKDLWRQIGDESMTFEMFRDLVAHRQIRRLRKGDTAEPVYKEQLARWEERWKRDLSALWIPERQEGFDRLIVVPQGMRPNKAFGRIETSGVKAWRYTEDLDCISSDRIANADHAAWVRDVQEADSQLRDLSADDCLARLVSGINLEERLVFEEDYFLETGRHLDEASVTLCTGSRYSDGDVPYVRWDGGRVCVYWTSRDDANPRVGVRQVVS